MKAGLSVKIEIIVNTEQYEHIRPAHFYIDGVKNEHNWQDLMRNPNGLADMQALRAAFLAGRIPEKAFRDLTDFSETRPGNCQGDYRTILKDVPIKVERSQTITYDPDEIRAHWTNVSWYQEDFYINQPDEYFHDQFRKQQTVQYCKFINGRGELPSFLRFRVFPYGWRLEAVWVKNPVDSSNYAIAQLSETELKTLERVKKYVGKRFDNYDFWFVDNGRNWEGGYKLGSDLQFRNQYSIRWDEQYDQYVVTKNWE
jgi:hypothetical protein